MNWAATEYRNLAAAVSDVAFFSSTREDDEMPTINYPVYKQVTYVINEYLTHLARSWGMIENLVREIYGDRIELEPLNERTLLEVTPDYVIRHIRTCFQDIDDKFSIRESINVDVLADPNVWQPFQLMVDQNGLPVKVDDVEVVLRVSFLDGLTALNDELIKLIQLLRGRQAQHCPDRNPSGLHDGDAMHDFTQPSVSVARPVAASPAAARSVASSPASSPASSVARSVARSAASSVTSPAVASPVVASSVASPAAASSALPSPVAAVAAVAAVAPCPVLKHVSYCIILHGGTISNIRYCHSIEPKLGENMCYTVSQGECPTLDDNSYGTYSGLTLTQGTDYKRQDVKTYIQGNNPTFDKCAYQNGQVALQPMVFMVYYGVDPNEVALGIWAFHEFTDGTFERHPVVSFEQLKIAYSLDRSYGTYMQLFIILRRDLNTLRANSGRDDFGVNVLFNACRIPPPVDTPPLDIDGLLVNSGYTVPVRRDGAIVNQQLKMLPNAAQLSVSSNPADVGRLSGFVITLPNSATMPRHLRVDLGSRYDVPPHDRLHYIRQGCFYYMMVAMELITLDEGNLMANIQSSLMSCDMGARLILNACERKIGAGFWERCRLEYGLIVHRLDCNPTGFSVLKTYMDQAAVIASQPAARQVDSAAAIIVKFHSTVQGDNGHGHWTTFYTNGTTWLLIDPQVLSLYQGPDGQTRSNSLAYLNCGGSNDIVAFLTMLCQTRGYVLFSVFCMTNEDTQRVIATARAPPAGGRNKRRRSTLKNKKYKKRKPNTINAQNQLKKITN